MSVRGVLFGAAAGLGLGSAPALAAPPANTLPPAADQALARDILKEQIAINTVEPKGSTASAEALAKRFRAGGFSRRRRPGAGPGRTSRTRATWWCG